MQDTEVLASQRVSPLKPEQGEQEASQQRVADVIHEGNFLHGPGAFRDEFIIWRCATATRECQSLPAEACLEQQFGYDAPRTSRHVPTRLGKESASTTTYYFSTNQKLQPNFLCADSPNKKRRSLTMDTGLTMAGHRVNGG